MRPPLLPYPYHLLRELTDVAPKQQVVDRMKRLLEGQYKDLRAAFEAEGATHREHNINTNFDGIEISGSYDQATRTAINIVAQELFDEGLIEPRGASRFSSLLRIADPTDRLITLQQKPDRIDWVTEQISQDEFATFADWESLLERVATPSDDWVPLFERTEQRISDGMGSRVRRRMSIAMTTLFVAPKKTRRPKPEALDDLLDDWVNLYRSELPQFGVNKNTPDFQTLPCPLVQVSTRSFRGSRPHAIAAVQPSLAKLLGLERDQSDYFGLRFGEELIARSTEWQEGYDQGRRRHLPISSGFLLEMRRSFLQEWIETSGLRLWMRMKTERSITQYLEESQMDWEEQADVVEMKF